MPKKGGKKKGKAAEKKAVFHLCPDCDVRVERGGSEPQNCAVGVSVNLEEYRSYHLSVFRYLTECNLAELSPAEELDEMLAAHEAASADCAHCSCAVVAGGSLARSRAR